MKYNINLKFILAFSLYAIAIILTGSTVGLEFFRHLLEIKGISEEFLLADLMCILYLVLCIIFILSLGIYLCIRLLIYKPLENITSAAKEFSCGNLNHEIGIESSDEFGYLAATLNYMATILKERGKYQKQLVGNISHDFRSPLTSIKGYTNALMDGTIKFEDQNKYLQIIADETDRLSKLADDLLCLIELENQKVRLKKDNVPLLSSINGVCHTFNGALKDKGLSFILSYNTSQKSLGLTLPMDINNLSRTTHDLAGHDLNIYVDEEKIKRVFINLIDNAIKFSYKNSEINLIIDELNDKYLITLTDRGCGIADDQVGKVFRQFYKADHSRGINKDGSGLGLAIVQEIIQQHEENISVESIEGEGSKFIFTLPKSDSINKI